MLRRVKRGETLGITERGTLIAVLSPAPSGLQGAAALVEAGRVRRATRRLADIPAAVRIDVSTQSVLDVDRTAR
ncbi:MAG: hypothetical protein AB7H92_19275 [Microbacteriaceae bacterium]